MLKYLSLRCPDITFDIRVVLFSEAWENQFLTILCYELDFYVNIKVVDMDVSFQLALE